MAIRLSGLTSGMDTDAIVQELVSAYSKKTEKYEKASTKLTWKQDAWKNLNTKIYSLYTNVSNLRFSSAYNLRKVTVSDATKASVTASSAAVTGTQSLKILDTAQASYLTGGQLGKDVKADTKLKDLGYEGKNGSFKLKSADGSSKEISFTEDTTVAEVVNKLKEAGVNASFDENNRRIFVSAKKTGAANDFNLMGDTTEGLEALEALGLNSSLIEVDENGNKTFTEAAGNYAKYYEYQVAAKAEGKETWQYLKDLYTKYVDTLDEKKKNETEKAALINTNNAWVTTNQLLEDQISARESFDRIAAQSNFDEKDTKEILNALNGVELYTTDEDGNKVLSADAKAKIAEAYKVNHPDAAEGEPSDAQMETFVNVMEANAEDVASYHKYMTKFPSTDITESTADQLNAQLETNRTKMAENEAKIKEYDEKIAANEAFISANAVMDDIYVTSGANKEQNDETAAKADDLLGKIATYAEEAAMIYEDADGKYSAGKASKIKGTDAEIVLNGVTYTSNDNNFSINGLSINALAKTDGEITISTSVDTQGIYDKVKDFLTEYNTVINEMMKLYNADSAGDYEPLTDEEKEAMSDDQIEKWENKIKDSLLRRDTTLNSIMSVMINSMAQTFEIGGQKLSLSTFGIQTLGFLNAPKNEQYAYHINGDEDDENTSGKEDKLMAAIQQNPEQVEEFMKKLTENLYKEIDNKMKSTELSSAYKVYNDKEMDREAKKYTDAISKWEEKVKDKEDYYFKQFSNMEVALSKLQSQTSSISGLLGM